MNLGSPITDLDHPSGDGARRVHLSEAAQAVIDVLDECPADLQALRHRLKQEELPDEFDVDESDLPTPREQAEHIVARLESCAGVLRQAGGKARE